MEITTTTDPVNEIEAYASFIDSYGVAAVILGFFIFVFLIVLSAIVYSNKKSTNQLLKQQQMLLDQLIKQKDSNGHVKKEKNIVKTFLKIDEGIHDILKAISDHLTADRVSVYVFHNGSYSSHGLPFFKVSCISEVIKKGSGVTLKSKAHTCLPLNMFNTSIQRLSDDGQLIIKNIEESESEYPVLFNMLKVAKIQSAVGVAIYDNDNNILGVLIAEFRRDNSENIEKATEELIAKTEYLSPILEYSNISNANTSSSNDELDEGED